MLCCMSHEEKKFHAMHRLTEKRKFLRNNSWNVLNLQKQPINIAHFASSTFYESRRH
jgi:hypothetical protein